MVTKKRKAKFALDIIEDLVGDYLYYNRKHDEDLSHKELMRLFKDQDLTIDDIIKRFSEELKKAMEE